MKHTAEAIYDFQRCLDFYVKAQGDKQLAARMAAREMPFLKADVSGTEHSDLVGSYDSYMGGTFLTSIEGGQGIYEYLRQRSRRATFNGRLFIPSSTVSGSIVAESGAIPVSAYSMDASGLTPVKVGVLAVASNEALENGEGVSWLQQDLMEGMVLATDTRAVAILKAAVSSAANATADPVADIKTLLDSVNTTGFGDLAFLVSPAIANLLCTWKGTGGNLVFPDLSPTGGVICGTSAIVSGGVVDTEMLLVDSRGIVTGDEDVEFSISNQAIIEMEDAPAMESQGPTGPSGKVVNMFQLEATAVKAIRSFALKVPRTSAVHQLASISWGS